MTSNIAVTIGILISLILYSSSIVAYCRLLDRLYLPSSLTGPESLAFDSIGEGPYTGVSDGRILKYDKACSCFLEFAHISPHRNKTICDGISDFSELQETCGRPMGLSFHYKTRELYIADAYYGLVKVSYDGGAATQLVANVLGNPFGFLAGVDVDPNTGFVYFTEASYHHKIRDLQKLLNSPDYFSGSLFRYNPTTKDTTLLLRDLAMATGVAVSSNGSFVLISEYKANRIRRFWLTGPNAYSSDIFLWLPGRPDNIRRTSRNEFWVAVNYPFGSPPPPVPPVLPLGLRVNEQGLILEAVPLVEEFGTGSVSEVQEAAGKLYATSLRDNYVNILTV